jgi:hypothetical protein
LVTSGNDSELSELSSDEDDVDETYRPEERGCALDDESSGEEEESDGSNEEGDACEEQRHVFPWRKTDIPFQNVNFEREKEDQVEELSALDYFKLFWTEELTNFVVEQTNNYSVQKSGVSVNTTPSEIEQFIGMQMKMGVVNLPSYTHYWSNELRYPSIADIMPRKRYEKLRRFLHFVDNMTYDEHTADKLFKVWCIVEKVAANCRKVQPEENHSVEEQVIPSKTKYSNIRQYNPKKPVK